MQVTMGVCGRDHSSSPLRGYLMASQGSCDIFMVYLIEAFAGRIFLALHEEMLRNAAVPGARGVVQPEGENAHPEAGPSKLALASFLGQ